MRTMHCAAFLPIAISGLLALLGAALARASGTERLAAPLLLDLHQRDVVLYPGEIRRLEIPIAIPPGRRFSPQRVVKSCSCLSVDELPSTELGPGDKAEVQVALSAGALIGGLTRALVIYGTDEGGHQAAVRCSVDATVEDLVSWPTGSICDFGERPQAALPATLAIPLRRGHHPQPYDGITATLVGGAGITVAVHPVSAEAWTVGATLAASRVLGAGSARLVVSFVNQGKLLEYQASRIIRWSVTGAWTATPAGILFGVVPLDGSAEKAVLIANRDHPEIRPEISSIIPSDAVRVSATSFADGDSVRLRSTFAGASPAGPASGHLDVLLLDGTILRVPYFAAVGALSPAPPGGIASPAPTSDPGF